MKELRMIMRLEGWLTANNVVITTLPSDSCSSWVDTCHGWVFFFFWIAEERWIYVYVCLYMLYTNINFLLSLYSCDPCCICKV